MSFRLNHGFKSAFNGNSPKSDAVANVLIDRALAGRYLGSAEYGEKSETGSDSTIIGQLYLMPADESTYVMRYGVEAFVLRLDHNQRIADYSEFETIEAARLFMTSKAL